MRTSEKAIATLFCVLAWGCAVDSHGVDDEGNLGSATAATAAAAATDRATVDQPAAVDAKTSAASTPPVRSPSSAGAPLTVEDLSCVHGGMVGKIRVAFGCSEITTVSCKDLSNVVLEFEDGSRQRFEGLNDQRGVFAGTGLHSGAVIVGVWVKAGANHSGDGPGYGERFDAPQQSCTQEECTVPDGSCTPTVPPPPENDCMVADGVCAPGKVPPPPPPPAQPATGI